MDSTQRDRIGSGRGFAALHQSSSSTPEALAEYGFTEDRYSG